MKYIFYSLPLSILLLAGCQLSPSLQEKTGISEGSIVDEQSSSAQYVHWETYQDTTFGIHIDYPSDEYFVTSIPFKGIVSGAHLELDDYIQFGDKKIAIEGVRIGDNMAEGHSVQFYRTKDARILDYLNRDNDFSKTKVVNAVSWQQYGCKGGCLGDVYGYLMQKDGYYYVFESMWGPENPVSERMLQSLSF